MKEKRKSLIRFILILAAVLLAGFALIRFGGLPNSWAPSGEIKGNTPLEKTQSLVDSLSRNRDYKNFGRVFLTKIDYQDSTWVYSAMIFKSMQEIDQDQASQMKYFTILREVFSRTASFEFVKRIVVLVEFSDGFGFFVTANEEGIKKIREYPKEALLYAQQVPAQMTPVSNKERQEGGGK